MTVEEKRKFKDIGITDFKQKTEKWSQAKESKNNEQSQLQTVTFAFTRMN